MSDGIDKLAVADAILVSLLIGGLNISSIEMVTGQRMGLGFIFANLVAAMLLLAWLWEPPIKWMVTGS